MKLYLVTRNDETDYDEYDSFVVRAENEEEAIELCKYSYMKNSTVTEITQEGERGQILGSYNAG